MKPTIAILIDIFDFTIGRLLFATSFAGEINGLILVYIMSGPRAFWCAVEDIDVTEQVDGFIPTMTLVAMASD